MGAATKALVTRRELAAALDAHVRTIAKWELEGLPVARLGKNGRPSMYDEATCRAWVKEHQTEIARNRQEVDEARARKERAQAALAEQLALARSQDLLPRADVERAWAAEVAAVRAKLLAWPEMHADSVKQAADQGGVVGVVRALQEAVRDVLRELAGADREEQARPKRRTRVA